MSKAFKCNRCKMCFDPTEGVMEFTTIREYFEQTPMDYETNHACLREEDVHLCPGCTSDFNYFMSGADFVPADVSEALEKEVYRLQNEKEELINAKNEEGAEDLFEMVERTPPEILKSVLCTCIGDAVIRYRCERSERGCSCDSVRAGETSKRKKCAKKDCKP